MKKKSKMISTVIQEEDSSFQYSPSNCDISGRGDHATSRFYKELYQRQMNARTTDRKDYINQDDSSNVIETVVKDTSRRSKEQPSLCSENDEGFLQYLVSHRNPDSSI